MKLLLLALTGVTLSACGSKSKDPAAACAEAAKHGVEAMINQARGRIAASQLPEDVRARMLERQSRLEAAGSKMRAVFTNRCVDDKWSSAALTCYMKVASLEDMGACRKQLTAEQQAKLQKDELELLAGTPEKLEQPIGSTTTPEAIAALEQEVVDAKTKLDVMEKDQKRSDKDRAIASADYLRAMDELETARNRQRLDELAEKLEDLNERVSEAGSRVATADSQAAREAAKVELEALRAEQAKLKAEFQSLISSGSGR